MRRSSFVAMILGSLGGVLFALGMCMCLIPAWNAFVSGVAMGTAGMAILLAAAAIWRRMENKSPIYLSGRTIGGLLAGALGSLLLGVGMCMVMVWSRLEIGILIGVAGIVALVCLIPLVKGLR